MIVARHGAAGHHDARTAGPDDLVVVTMTARQADALVGASYAVFARTTAEKQLGRAVGTAEREREMMSRYEASKGNR